MERNQAIKTLTARIAKSLRELKEAEAIAKNAEALPVDYKYRNSEIHFAWKRHDEINATVKELIKALDRWELVLA